MSVDWSDPNLWAAIATISGVSLLGLLGGVVQLVRYFRGLPRFRITVARHRTGDPGRGGDFVIHGGIQHRGRTGVEDVQLAMLAVGFDGGTGAWYNHPIRWGFFPRDDTTAGNPGGHVVTGRDLMQNAGADGIKHTLTFRRRSSVTFDLYPDELFRGVFERFGGYVRVTLTPDDGPTSRQTFWIPPNFGEPLPVFGQRLFARGWVLRWLRHPVHAFRSWRWFRAIH